MIQIVIFSFNRAMQLDTLLSSIQRYWKSPEYKITVLYNSTSEKYEMGYLLLSSRYVDVKFVKEDVAYHKIRFSDVLNIRNILHFIKYPQLIIPKSDFRKKLIQEIEETAFKHIMFLTDDSMFINEVYVPISVIEWITSDPYSNECSLRLGQGVNNEPANITRNNDGYEWNTYDVPQDNNWGYQFSVDAHIYDKELILKLFKTYVFSNPNTLEGYICTQVRRKHWISKSKCPLEPKLLSYPINMVQTFTENESLGVSTEKMNDLFLDGYIMEYPIPPKIVTFQQYPDYVKIQKNGEEKIFKTR